MALNLNVLLLACGVSLSCWAADVSGVSTKIIQNYPRSAINQEASHPTPNTANEGSRTANEDSYKPVPLAPPYQKIKDRLQEIHSTLMKLGDENLSLPVAEKRKMVVEICDKFKDMWADSIIRGDILYLGHLASAKFEREKLGRKDASHHNFSGEFKMLKVLEPRPGNKAKIQKMFRDHFISIYVTASLLVPRISRVCDKKDMAMADKIKNFEDIGKYVQVD